MRACRSKSTSYASLRRSARDRLLASAARESTRAGDHIPYASPDQGRSALCSAFESHHIEVKELIEGENFVKGKRQAHARCKNRLLSARSKTPACASHTRSAIHTRSASHTRSKALLSERNKALPALPIIRPHAQAHTHGRKRAAALRRCLSAKNKQHKTTAFAPPPSGLRCIATLATTRRMASAICRGVNCACGSTTAGPISTAGFLAQERRACTADRGSSPAKSPPRSFPVALPAVGAGQPAWQPQASQQGKEPATWRMTYH